MCSQVDLQLSLREAPFGPSSFESIGGLVARKAALSCTRSTSRPAVASIGAAMTSGCTSWAWDEQHETFLTFLKCVANRKLALKCGGFLNCCGEGEWKEGFKTAEYDFGGIANLSAIYEFAEICAVDCSYYYKFMATWGGGKECITNEEMGALWPNRMP